MEVKFILLVSLFGTAQAGNCHVSLDDRVDCGWVGINQATCRAKGCCWDNTIQGKPFCYISKLGSVPSCIIGPKPRTDCGWLGITQETCKKRTCCYGQTDPGIPWCYVKDFGELTYGMCHTAPSERKDCGAVGITKEQCLGKACCYDDSFDDGKTPWCFHPPAPAGSCKDGANTGTCKYVCEPYELNHVYGKGCTEGRWCCY